MKANNSAIGCVTADTGIGETYGIKTETMNNTIMDFGSPIWSKCTNYLKPRFSSCSCMYTSLEWLLKPCFFSRIGIIDSDGTSKSLFE